MGEKQAKSEDVEKKNKGEQGGGEKKVEKKENGGAGGGAITVVLKVDMHCEGCAKKVQRSVKGFEGVETVTTDSGNNKLMVMGKVDPWKLRDRVEVKTHKQVTLVSPTDYPKKKEEPKKEEEKKEKKVEDPKPKPKPTSVVLKIRLHCDGCIQRIKRTIRKVKGVEEVSVDTQKELVTVKGTMDVKAMVPYLQDKFKRNVDVAPSAAKKEDGGEKSVKKDDGGGDKKDKEKTKETENSTVAAGDKGISVDGEKKKKDGGGEKGLGGDGEKKKDGGGDGEKKKDGGGDGEKKKEGGGDGEKKKDGGGEKEKDGGKNKKEVVGTSKVETSKMEYFSGGGYVPQHYYMQNPPIQQYQQHYQYENQPYQQPQMAMPVPMVPPMPTSQYSMFSDEDPNACSVM